MRDYAHGRRSAAERKTCPAAWSRHACWQDCSHSGCTSRCHWMTHRCSPERNTQTMVQRKDRQKKEFHDQSDYRQWCMLLMSSTNLSSHTGRHNKQFFHSAAGNAKIYLKNYNIIPRLTLLMETFIHTYHRSFTVLSDKSIYTVSLPWKLSDFLDTSFSWTLSFPQGPYFSSFFSGDRYLFHLPQFVGLQPTDTTRLISGRACLGVSTIKSAALTSPPPRVNLLVPVPAATYNTCSAYN